MDAALRALNRFGLGARAGERHRLRDPRGWLRAQLGAGAPLLPAPAGGSAADVTAAVRGLRMAAQGSAADRQAARREAQRRLRDTAAAESAALIAARVSSEQPFVERLVAFWSNHLCVSMAAKVLVAPLAGDYERAAIRPHVLGRFEDMVLASAQHPAMLVYLDNALSIGPNSSAARTLAARRGQQRGLNENYARELLELHTLGVEGGYTQQDVQELAKVLTGWTVEGLGGPGVARLQSGSRRGRGNNAAPAAPGSIAFTFQEPLHEPGSKRILGTTFAAAGVAEGERVIRALCRHTSTARFIATKLVRHFVADDPPAAAVDRIARTFRDTEGDLRAVSAALIELPEAWSEDTRKFRTPQEWLVAALRALEERDGAAAALLSLRQLRHPLWSPAAPDGFSDRMRDWADADALLNRAELARTIARRAVRGIDPQTLADVVDVTADDPLPRLLSDTSIAASERVALALAGPAFQWR